MVEVIDPQKNEIILDPACGTAGFLISSYKLDPACGTAGFLISSYKHIMKANTKKTPGDLLTTKERKKLMDNFIGYDISPDMVRLSLVNLYLHGFSQPKIFEYDTLTSDERWNEYAGAILTNPPFMSPKGGIKPHKKFSIQSNRSEVLFVDYNAEHLNTAGRAAVIVPEGIIFQSGKAYKQLRKSLVEKYLYAVVSLPSGVFNPYAGVKTSILFLDTLLAQKSDSILFVKIENDGFSLGAQRRAIDKNDLPRAVEIIKKFRKELMQGRRGAEEKREEILPRTTRNNTNEINYLVVYKDKIAESGEYNLSGERYRETEQRGKQKWSMVRLGEIFDITSSKRVFESEWKNKGVPFYRAREIVKLAKDGFVENELFISEEMFEEYSLKYVIPQEDDMMVTGVGTLGVCYVVKKGDRFYFKDGNIIWFKKKTDNITNFVKYLFQTDFIKRQIQQTAGVTVGTYTIVNAKKTQIPLPSIEVQQEIVTEIEGYQKIIDGARQVVDNWKPHIDIDPDWSLVRLGDTCDDFKNGLNFSAEQVGKGTKFVNIKDVFSDGHIDTSNLEKVEISEKEKQSKLVSNNDLLFVRSSVKYEGVGFPSLINPENEEIVFCGFLIKCTPNIKVVLPEYLLYLLRTTEYRNKTVLLSNKANITNISQESIKSLEIPLPPLETQRSIVTEIEAEKKAVNGCHELIAIYEGKIKTVIERVWGKDSNET